jgi:hypothetical protein
MEVKRDWQLVFDPERFIGTQEPSFARLLAKPNVRQAFEEALAEIGDLVAPAACWDRYPVVEIRHDKLVLAGGARLGGGPVVSVAGGASELIVAVCTAGQAVSDRANALQRDGQRFKSLILNDLGSWAVDLMRQQLCRMFEDQAKAQGLRISAALSPGESEWSVKDQEVIFALLDAGQIGVTLSPSMVMSPLKSLSLILGTGTQPMGVEGASNCDFCTMRERCRYRLARTL